MITQHGNFYNAAENELSVHQLHVIERWYWVPIPLTRLTALTLPFCQTCDLNYLIKAHAQIRQISTNVWTHVLGFACTERQTSLTNSSTAENSRRSLYRRQKKFKIELSCLANFRGMHICVLCNLLFHLNNKLNYYQMVRKPRAADMTTEIADLLWRQMIINQHRPSYFGLGLLHVVEISSNLQLLCIIISSDWLCVIVQVLASIGQLEFFYDQAPDIMRSCSMALQLLSVAMGSYLSGAVVGIVGVVTRKVTHSDGWLPKDMNYGRLDLFFVFLAGVLSSSLIRLITYVLIFITPDCLVDMIVNYIQCVLLDSSLYWSASLIRRLSRAKLAEEATTFGRSTRQDWREYWEIMTVWFCV